MPKNGEVVSIHAGEAGVHLGNATWELYCIEHGIRRDGYMCKDREPESSGTFFTSTPAGKCFPRAVFMDTESSVLDEIRVGDFRYLYHPKQLVSGKEDSANCFAKGYLTVGREMIDAVMERIRVSAEECSRLQGFLVYRAVGGGTGSGTVCYLLEQLANDYKKLTTMEIGMYPAPKLSSVVVEPYNAMLSTHSSMGTINCSLIFENDAVYDICDHELDITRPNFVSINRVVGQVMSAITAQFRFEGDPNVTLSEFQTNLVPYPRIHFPLIGYAPFLRPSIASHEPLSVMAITNACFEPGNQMVKCNSKSGKYMSCCLLYRGDISNSEINSTLASLKMKKSVKFVSWLPTRFKVGVNPVSPIVVAGGEIAPVTRSCVLVANNTSMQTAFEKLNRKFDLLYAKKAYVHWYVAEGLEESDFLETRLDMQALVSDFKEVESDL